MLTLLTFEFLPESKYNSKSNGENVAATNLFCVAIVGKNSNLHGAGLSLLAYQHYYQCNYWKFAPLDPNCWEEDSIIGNLEP